MCPGPASKALGGSSFPRIRRCLKFSLTSVLGVCYFVSRSSALLETCLLPISKPEVSKCHMDKQPSAFTQQGYNTAVHFLLLPLGDPSIPDSSAQPHPSTQTTTQPSTYSAVPPPISPSLHPSHHQSPHAFTLQSPGQRLWRVPPVGSHPTSLSVACRFFLHNISEIWPSLPICTAKTLVKTLSISHLNYCKILLPAWQMQPHPALPTPSPCPATTIPANHSLKSFMLQKITHKHLL